MAELTQYIRQEADRLASACTGCGRCVEACPMTPYVRLPELTVAGEVAEGVKAVLRGEAGPSYALSWLNACTWSGACIPACPEHIDPLVMVRLARIIAVGGMGGTRQIETGDDKQYFTRLRMFAKLQLSEDEFREWM